MEREMLIEKYRQLDYDLAAVHSILNSTRENKMQLFIPTEENCNSIETVLCQLKERIENLETDGKPFEFIKNPSACQDKTSFLCLHFRLSQADNISPFPRETYPLAFFLQQGLFPPYCGSA